MPYLAMRKQINSFWAKGSPKAARFSLDGIVLMLFSIGSLAYGLLAGDWEILCNSFKAVY